jgi:hypothetical protein
MTVSVLIMSIFILICSSLILIFLALNLQVMFPFLVKEETSIKKISRQTKFSPAKVALILKIINSITKFWL